MELCNSKTDEVVQLNTKATGFLLVTLSGFTSSTIKLWDDPDQKDDYGLSNDSRNPKILRG